MPRSHPTRSIRLILPPTVSRSVVSSSASKTTTPLHPPTQPDIAVLLRAQALASDRGEVLDILSFMDSTQRRCFLTLMQKAARMKVPPDSGFFVEGMRATQLGQDGELEEKDAMVHGEKVVGNGESDDDGSQTPAPAAEGDALPTPPPFSALDSPLPDMSSVPTPVFLAPTPKKQRVYPDLSHLHWKQREKRLKQMRVAEEVEELGLTVAGSPMPEGSASQEVPVVAPVILHHPKSRTEITAQETERIQASASYWNSLLIQARKERGPQWDYNTQSYQVDRSTPDYYTHMSDPPTGIPAASTHGRPHASSSSATTLDVDTSTTRRASGSISVARRSHSPSKTPGKRARDEEAANGSSEEGGPRSTGRDFVTPSIRSFPTPSASGPASSTGPTPTNAYPSTAPRLNSGPPGSTPQSQMYPNVPPHLAHSHYTPSPAYPAPPHLPQQDRSRRPLPSGNYPFNPAQLAQLQFAGLPMNASQNPALNPAMNMQHLNRGGTGVNPSALGGVDFSRLADGRTPGGGGGGMIGVNGVQMRGGGSLNPLGQHGPGFTQGQEPMVALNGSRGKGPMLAGSSGGGIWEGFNS